MKRRVAFFADHVAHWNAGTERQMLMLARGLARRGWDVPLYVLTASDAAQSGEWPCNVEVVAASRLSSPLSWLRLLRVARAERGRETRVAHCYFNDTSIIVPPVFRSLGIRIVVSRRDMGFWYTPANRLALRFVRRFVGLVVANSYAVARSVRDAEGYRPDEVAVVYNGVDVPGNLPAASTNAGPVIGIVANLRPIKRIGDAIRAFAKIAEKHPEAILRIVGGGDEAGLVQVASRMNVAGRVQFTGRIESPGDELTNFSVGMLTSESEGLSNSIIEYMLAGLPVVCTSAGGNPELVEEGVNGFLVEVGDVSAMADRLDQLLRSGELRRSLGQAGRAKAQRKFSTVRMVEAHEELYARLAA